ncbi:hypothetical protein GE09DRAFT_1066857 [Coniochaeta sp. 2T2.1]|nr:hypothetical protein GE09DRAFT_1066857 [Coniochaeta sp. 2T2.1]
MRYAIKWSKFDQADEIADTIYVRMDLVDSDSAQSPPAHQTMYSRTSSPDSARPSLPQLSPVPSLSSKQSSVQQRKPNDTEYRSSVRRSSNTTSPRTARAYDSPKPSRYERNILYLTEKWNGNGWFPRDFLKSARKAVQEVKLNDSDVQYLRAVTKAALEHGLELRSLYQPGGVLYDAMAGSSRGLPVWTFRTARTAKALLHQRFGDSGRSRHASPSTCELTASQTGSQTQSGMQAESQSPAVSGLLYRPALEFGMAEGVRDSSFACAFANDTQMQSHDHQMDTYSRQHNSQNLADEQQSPASSTPTTTISDTWPQQQRPSTVTPATMTATLTPEHGPQQTNDRPNFAISAEEHSDVVSTQDDATSHIDAVYNQAAPFARSVWGSYLKAQPSEGGLLPPREQQAEATERTIETHNPHDRLQHTIRLEQHDNAVPVTVAPPARGEMSCGTTSTPAVDQDDRDSYMQDCQLSSAAMPALDTCGIEFGNIMGFFRLLHIHFSEHPARPNLLDAQLHKSRGERDWLIMAQEAANAARTSALEGLTRAQSRVDKIVKITQEMNAKLDALVSVAPGSGFQGWRGAEEDSNAATANPDLEQLMAYRDSSRALSQKAVDEEMAHLQKAQTALDQAEAEASHSVTPSAADASMVYSSWLLTQAAPAWKAEAA